MVVIASFCRYVLHWRGAEQAIYLALNDYFPGELANFLKRNLAIQGRLQLTSMVLLLFTANGIFEPLEVALNRAWGVTVNRSYVKNQVISLALIMACGALALLSLMLTALGSQFLPSGAGVIGTIGIFLQRLFFKLAAVPVSMLSRRMLALVFGPFTVAPPREDTIASSMVIVRSVRQMA